MKKSIGHLTAPRLWLVMTRSHHGLRQLAEQSIAKAGLCLTDFAALEALLHKGPLSISEIQGKVLLASGSMTAAVDRLEKRGLVVRKSSPDDRRARIVKLTQQGKRLAASCFEKHANDLEAVMSVLSQREKRQMYSSLKRLGIAAAETLDKQEHLRAEGH
ncbi:MAG: MarR family transcriptional regulator [Acidobacteria bacterium]|nr:MAG: MarR family transcriptional regulator [Acidobacteriota bacterium]PYY09693.1 MAG: MarR family transcriptional regulator [Acidobacteriota bacterium]